MKIMKKKTGNSKLLFLLSLLLLAGAAPVKVSAKEKVVDKVVARVNNEVILLSEFNQRADQIIKEYEKVFEGPDKEKQLKELKQELLNQMIDEKLLLQKAEKEKIRITDSEIDQGVDEIRNRFSSEVEFQNEISKQGLSGAEFRENIANQLKVIKLINQEVKSKITPPAEEEVKKYYEENEEEMVSPEQVRARHILIATDKERSQDEAKEKINEIYEKAKKDPSQFSALAEKYSEGPSAKVGGDLGYFARGEMVKEFEDVAFKMKIGEISEPVKTRFGYHIIKLVGKKSKEKKTFSEVKDRLKNLLYQMKMEQEYEKFLRELRDEAKISKSLDEKK